MNIQHTVVWQRRDQPGTEYFVLSQVDEIIQLRGDVIVALNGLPVAVQYTIRCDGSWRTREVLVREQLGTEERTLHLTVLDQQWLKGGQALDELRGCSDVDLGVTPSTNTLPIRRLNLSVGQAVDITAAWVRFPELTVEPSLQRYTRLSENSYRYESLSYQADLIVDELGVVQRYADVWERVA